MRVKNTAQFPSYSKTIYLWGCFQWRWSKNTGLSKSRFTFNREFGWPWPPSASWESVPVFSLNRLNINKQRNFSTETVIVKYKSHDPSHNKNDYVTGSINSNLFRPNIFMPQPQKININFPNYLTNNKVTFISYLKGRVFALSRAGS